MYLYLITSNLNFDGIFFYVIVASPPEEGNGHEKTDESTESDENAGAVGLSRKNDDAQISSN